MAQDAAGAVDLLRDVDLGDGETGLGPGAGEDVAAGADHLGLAEEAHAAHRAGLVGGGQDDLVLGGAGLVVQVEELGLAVLGHARGAVGDAGGPGGQTGEDLGAVQGQGAGGLGEGLVVVDEHAETADGSVEGVEAVAGE